MIKARNTFIDFARQSGRTTRMLKKALELAAVDGQEVCIICADINHLEVIKRQLREMTGFNDDKLSDMGINFSAPKTNNFFVPKAFHTNEICCRYLYDHFTIQRYYGEILEAYHAFDIEMTVIFEDKGQKCNL